MDRRILSADQGIHKGGPTATVPLTMLSSLCLKVVLVELRLAINNRWRRIFIPCLVRHRAYLIN